MREITLSAVIGISLFGGELTAENWDRFRGPNGAGQSDSAAIPTEWQESNFLWKRPLAGQGNSSPVVWEERVFVTSADPRSGEQIVEAFDATSGERLWERRLAGAPHPMHAFNSFASSTPAVDERTLFVAWRDGDKIMLAALTHAGEIAWRVEAGRSEEKHGFGASPMLVDDLVVIANDNERAGELVAFDRALGQERWRIPRPSGHTAYATPCLLQDANGKQLILAASSAAGVTAIDPATSRVVWQALETELPQRVVASPFIADGLIFVACGQGGNGLHMIALKPPTDTEEAREVYRFRQGIPNVPTAVAAGDLLFLWHDGGTVTCLDVPTGRQVWRQRVGGAYHCSPIRIGDRIYCVSQHGEVVVLAADAKFKLLARNSLDEPTRATPAVANDRLYLRTDSSLICIGEPAGEN